MTLVKNIKLEHKVSILYTPETHSMAEIVAAIEAAAASGEIIYLGPGRYDLNINLPSGGSQGFGIIGAGRNRTFLVSAIANTPVFACQGLWYCRFVGLAFSHGSLGAGTMPAVDIDGQIGGRGVQGNTWQDCSFSGRGWYDGLRGHSAFFMCRVAGSAGQGSENCFINCHFYASTFACCAITGYNALNNQFYGGNVQDYTKHGMFFQAGSFHIYNMGFQSTTGLEQYDNDGWDIWANGGGVGDAVTVTGCRSESLRFYLGSGAQPANITNCNQRVALYAWAPYTTYNPGGVGYASGLLHDNKVYRILNTFTSGATFAVGSDLELINFDVVYTTLGKIDNCFWQSGNVFLGQSTDNLGRGTDVDYEMLLTEKWVAAHAQSNNVTVTLPNPQSVPEGYEVSVVRTDHNSANLVRVYGSYFDNNPANIFYDDLNTTTKRSGRYKAIGGHYVARRWYRLPPEVGPLLTNLSSVTTAADKLIYASGVNQFTTTDITPFARTILDDIDASGVRNTLGLGALALLDSVPGGSGTTLTFVSGIIRTGDVVGNSPNQNIVKLSNLTTNGFIKTSGSDGTLSVDVSTYLTGNESITLTGHVTGSGTTSISTTLASGIDPTRIANGSVNATEFQYLDGVTSAIQTQINGKQPLDDELTAIAGLTSAANKLPYFTGAGTASLTDLSSFGRNLIDDADAAAARTTLGLGSAALYPTSIFASGTHTHNSSDITDFSESVDDRVASLITARSGVRVVYNDAGNNLAITLPEIAPSGFFGNSTNSSVNPDFISIATARKMLRKEKYRLNYSSTIDWDLDNGLYQDIVPSGTFQLNFPYNVIEGESAFIYVHNNSSGTGQVTFASGFKAPGGMSGIQLSASGNKMDRLEFFFHHPASCTVTITKDIR